METSWDETAPMPSAHANNGPATNAQWVRESRCPAKLESPSRATHLPPTPPHPTPGPAMPPPNLPIGAISGVSERETEAGQEPEGSWGWGGVGAGRGGAGLEEMQAIVWKPGRLQGIRQQRHQRTRSRI